MDLSGNPPHTKTSASEPFALIAVFLCLFMAFGGWFLFARPPVTIAALDVPQVITFQGKLTDQNRITVDDAALNMRFAIYDADTGGTCLWSADDTDANSATIDCGGDTPDGAISVTPSDGVFTALLGDTTDGQNALPDDLFDNNASLFLGLTIAADAEMSPRIRIASSPYALQAGDADLLDGLDSASFATSTTAFFQNGNSFGGAAVLGTNDSNSLSFETNGVTRATLDTSGNLVIGKDVAATASISKTFTTPHSGSNVPSALAIGVEDGGNLSGMIVSDFADGGFNSQAIEFRTADGGVTVATNRFSISETGTIVANETGAANADFRIEGDTEQNLLFVDASADRIGLGTASPGDFLALEHNFNGPTALTITNTNGSSSARTGFYAIENSGTSAFASFEYLNSGFPTSDLQLPSQGKFVSGQAATGGLLFSALGASAPIVFAQGNITSASERLRIGATESVFNDNQQNVDFRVESDTNANGIFLDASAETIDLVGGSGSTGCSVDASGNLACTGTISGSGGAFVQNGNSFGGAAVLGTNDANSLSFETNATTWETISTTGQRTLAADTDYTLTGGVNGLSFDGTTFSVDATNDRIGIGTAAPALSLHILSSTTDPRILLEATNASFSPDITFRPDSGFGNQYEIGVDTTDNLFKIADSAGFSSGTLLSLDGATNRVGILTTTPSVAFQVNGAVGIGASLNASNTDRSLNIVDAAAVVKIQRFTATTSLSPSVELVWGTNNDQGGAGNFFWDFFVGAGGGGSVVDSFNIRRRTGNVDQPVATWTSTSAIFNDAGDDYDFRAETDTNANGIFLDASAETIDLVGGSGSTGCSVDASGNLACSGTVSGGGSSAFVQNGNSFAGAAVLGTNDTNTLSFETNNTTRATVGLSTDDIFTITGGTLASTKSALVVTGSLPNPGTASQIGASLTFSTTGAADSQQLGLVTTLNAGYTGNRNTIAVSGINNLAGTKNQITAFNANFGGGFFADGTTAGANVGAAAEASGSSAFNVGLIGQAQTAANSTPNVGVMGFGKNTGTSPIQVGGFFSLLGVADSVSTLTSAALIADNAATTSDIFVARDNGTPVFSILDGGSWSLPSDTAVSLGGGVNGLNFDNNTLSIDATNNLVGIGTAAPTSDLEVRHDFNGAAAVALSNDNGGTSARSVYVLTADATGNMFGQMSLTSAAFSPLANLLPAQLSFRAGNLVTNGFAIDLTATDAPFKVYTGGLGTTGERLAIYGTTTGETVFNDTSNNFDFRVETDGNANGIFVDASAETIDLVGGSGSTGCSVDASGNLACSGTVSGGGSSAFVQNGNSFAGAAVLGTNDSNSLSFETAGTTWETVSTTGQRTLAADTDYTLSGGVNGLSFDGTTFSVDATNNRVGIGRADPVSLLTVGPSTGVSGTDASKLFYVGENTTSTRGMRFENGLVTLDFVASTDGHGYVGTFNNASLGFQVNNIQRMLLNPTGIVINEDSTDYDFRAETDTNAKGIFLDASAETIDLVGGSASTGCSVDASGNLACAGTVSGGGSAAFVQNGNSFAGAAVLGTNDSNTLSFETAGTTRETISITGQRTLAADTDYTLTGGVNGLSFDGTTFSVDATNNRIGIGTAAPSHVVEIAGGTLADTVRALSVTGTLNSTSGNEGSRFTFTSSGAGATNQSGSVFALGAGYTGSQIAVALQAFTSTAGTGNNLRFDTSDVNPFGNSGFNAFSDGTTTGLNVGGYSEAANGNLNVGAVGKAVTAKASTTNIGVIGVGRNTNVTAPIEIGGYFGLFNSTPTFDASAGLIASNGATTNSIFLARDNNSTVFTIADGGTLTQDGGAVFNEAGSSTADFRVETDANTNGIFLDASAETIDLVGGSGSTGCSVDASGNFACSGTGTYGGVLALTAANAWTLDGTSQTVTADKDISLTGGVNGFSFDGTTFSVDATNDRIGIGTAAPTTELEVQHDQTAETYVKVRNTTTDTAARAGFYAVADEAGGAGVVLEALSSTFSSIIPIEFSNFGAVIADVNLSGLTLGTVGSGDPIVLGTAGIERMRIEGDGDVGIGTDTPGEAVHLKRTSGSANFQVNSSDTTGINGYVSRGGDGTDTATVFAQQFAAGSTAAGVFFGNGGSVNRANTVGIAFGSTADNAVIRHTANTPLLLGQNDAVRFSMTATEAVVNDPGLDYDFRAETDTNANGIFLDASAETIDLVGGSGSTGCSVDASGNFACSGTLTGSVAFANTALSNLSAVAINTSLLPASNDTIDLGDNTHRWNDIFLGASTLHLGTSTSAEGTISYTDTTQDTFNFGTDATGAADIAFFTDDLYLDKSAGRVGIGNATPNALLDLRDGTAATLRLSTPAINNTNSGTIEFSEGTGSSLLGFSLSYNGSTDTLAVGSSAIATMLTFDRNSGQTVFNETGASGADVRMEGDTNANLFFLDASADAIGLGTTTPAAMLNIFEPDESTTQTNLTQAVANAGILVSYDHTDAAYTAGLFWNTPGDNPTKPKAGIYLLNDTSDGTTMLFGTSNTFATGLTNSALAIAPTGNVGVGVTTPGELFSVGSGDLVTINSTGTLAFNSNQGPSQITFSGGDTSPAITIGSGAILQFSDGSNLMGQLADAGTFGQWQMNSNATAALPAYTFQGDTNLGIYRDGVDVLGFSANGTEIVDISTGGLDVIAGDVTITSGSLGVGDTTPDEALDVIGGGIFTDTVASTTINPMMAFVLSNSAAVGATGLGIRTMFQIENASSVVVDAGSIDVAWEVATSGAEEASMRFNTSVAGTITEVGRFDNAGNFGVGTTAPSEEFDVAGQIQFDLDGTTDTIIGVCKDNADSAGVSTAVEFRDCTSTPSDYAEWYETTGAEVIGDIVVAGSGTITYQEELFDHVSRLSTGVHDTYTTATVERSSVPYAGAILGIVSTNPLEIIGESLRETAAHPQPIALKGRVPTKVTTENGPIAVGDAITTSSTPGAGMKSTGPGMIVGYALEAYNGAGTGGIMVFVSPGWHAGTVIGTDGTMPAFETDFAFTSTGTADATTPGWDSHTLELRGSGWDGSAAQVVSMKAVTDVTSASEYRLSIKNAADTEVAYVTQDGVMGTASDLVVGGKLYPSAMGSAQTDAYIFYGGAGDDYMRTNAAGWGTGSYDFAEMFPGATEFEAGDVVAFDTSASEQVKLATAEDREHLAGIVSTRPGFLAGENREGDAPIALAGRVPTKVSEENGAIAVGDPLTVSATKPGYAMKATEAGVIVGYALEPFTGATGDDLIIAFVNTSWWGGGATDAVMQTVVTQNSASQAPSNEFQSLNMYGAIYMYGNPLVNVGRIAGLSDIWSIDETGTFVTEGSYEVAIEGHQGETVRAATVISTQHKVTLSGSGKLSGGYAEISFEDVDPLFNDIISTTEPVRVLVTLRGPANGLYVDQANRNGFMARETMGGTSDADFDWYVEGIRKDYEPVTEEPVVEPPAEEPVIEEPPAEQPPAEEPPAEEPPVAEEPPAEAPVPETLPAEEPPVVEEPVVEPPAEEPVIEEPPAEPPPAEEPPAEEPPPVETP